jgi:hypothetical protein
MLREAFDADRFHLILHGVWVPGGDDDRVIANCAPGSATVHLDAIKLSSASLAMHEEEDVMERRHFMKLAVGMAAGVAGAVALAASAQAAPLLPQPLAEDGRLPPANEDVRPAVTTADEVNRLQPEEVRWGWHRRHWGWHRRHWGHRHWGWRHRWHRRWHRW